MNIKKVAIIGFCAGALYLGMFFSYFGKPPATIYYCPTSMPNQEKIELTDPNFPGHTFTAINDVSCMNKTRVYDVIHVKTIEDIQQAIETAQDKSLHVSISGVRHSMGGQAFFKDAIVLDMRGFNKILNIDEENKTITAQSGATWHDIQNELHKKNLAVLSMQSTDIFTVGGSISVNAHGMDHNAGSISSTIESFTIMLASGKIKKASRKQNTELFHAAIGGYGLLGIILETTLQVTNNVNYKRNAYVMPTETLPQFFKDSIKENRYGLLYAHLSTSPLSFMQETLIYGYEKIEANSFEANLKKSSLPDIKRYVLNLAKIRPYARVFKWFIEKHFETSQIASRNQVMHDSVEYLNNILIDETDLLHEYFVPRKKLPSFLEKIKPLLQKSGFPILNISIRVVQKEDILLNYAPKEMYSIVLYLNQKLQEPDLRNMKQLTQDLIDITLDLHGTFFLPYQLCFTKDQLKKAYPNIDTFFALKRKYDPNLLFMNYFYNKYA